MRNSSALLASLTSLDDQETLDKVATLLENVPAALSIVADTIRTNALSLDEILQRLQAYTPREGNKAKAAVERAFQLLNLMLSEEGTWDAEPGRGRLWGLGGSSMAGE